MEKSYTGPACTWYSERHRFLMDGGTHEEWTIEAPAKSKTEKFKRGVTSIEQKADRMVVNLIGKVDSATGRFKNWKKNVKTNKAKSWIKQKTFFKKKSAPAE